MPIAALVTVLATAASGHGNEKTRVGVGVSDGNRRRNMHRSWAQHGVNST